MPLSFSFILTDVDGNRTYTTVLYFDEGAPQYLKNKIPIGRSKGKFRPEELDKIQCPKAICIVSHHSFIDAFRTMLTQIYQISLSSNNTVPLERIIVNIMDEIPLPDKGNLLIQYEIGTETIPFYRPVDQYPPYATKEAIENLFKCVSVDDVLEIFFQLILERKILLVSRYKTLLTQSCIAIMSFLFPLNWLHTLIPILPIEMIDILDAPLPFLIGIES